MFPSLSLTEGPMDKLRVDIVERLSREGLVGCYSVSGPLVRANLDDR